MSAELIGAEVLPDDKRVPLWDHIGELRNRLINSAIALFAATAVGYFMRFRLWDLAKRPLLRAAPDLISPFAYTDLTEPFMSMMRLSFWASVFVISPYLFYQVWAFIRPALRERERRMAVTFTAAARFYRGVPCSPIHRLHHHEHLMDEAVQAGLRPNLKPTVRTCSSVQCWARASPSSAGAVLLLARFGLVRSSAMLKYWRGPAAILFASAFLTPGDVIAV